MLDYLFVSLHQTKCRHTTESWIAENSVSEETMAKVNINNRSFVCELVVEKIEKIVPNPESPYLQVQALKMMVRWLLGVKSNSASSGTSTLRLLYTMVLHEGDLMEKDKIK